MVFLLIFSSIVIIVLLLSVSIFVNSFYMVLFQILTFSLQNLYSTVMMLFKVWSLLEDPGIALFLGP